MTGSFIKIKGILIPLITLVILTSQFAGCAAAASNEMPKSMQESSDVSMEDAIPDQEPQSSDASQAIDAGSQQSVSDSASEGELAAITDQQELPELTEAELHQYFQLAYDSGASLEGDMETRILGELDILVSLAEADDGGQLPDNYKQAYRDWRPEEAADLFTEVNEQVWAAEAVNLRSGPGTEHAQVGSLSKGDPVTRTGVGTAEAEGWSRVQLSDSSIVFVSSSYLSTAKPVVQQPSADDGQQQPQPGGAQSQDDKNRADNEAAGQGLAGLKKWGEQHQGTGNGFYEGLSEGAIVDENGNVGNAELNVR